jgi:hypothetical protein
VVQPLKVERRDWDLTLPVSTGSGRKSQQRTVRPRVFRACVWTVVSQEPGDGVTTVGWRRVSRQDDAGMA